MKRIKPIFERRLTEMCPIMYNISVNKRERRERRKESKMKETKVIKWRAVSIHELREYGTRKVLEKVFREDNGEWTHICYHTKNPIITKSLDQKEANKIIEQMKELVDKYPKRVSYRYTACIIE